MVDGTDRGVEAKPRKSALNPRRGRRDIKHIHHNRFVIGIFVFIHDALNLVIFFYDIVDVHDKVKWQMIADPHGVFPEAALRRLAKA